jgi:transcriptional regulator with XRE-family HTH domain
MTLRQLRQAANLSQMEAGMLSGLHQGTISALEIGKIPDPQLSTIDALARVYQQPRHVIILAIAKSLAEAKTRRRAHRKRSGIAESDIA